jgi:hypothetical protein
MHTVKILRSASNFSWDYEGELNSIVNFFYYSTRCSVQEIVADSIQMIADRCENITVNRMGFF